MKKSRFLLAPLLFLSNAALAQAHPGHGSSGLVAGFVHPLTGLDHLLAMVAVGLWAAQLGGRARWALPATFVSAMAVGATAGIAGCPHPGVEEAILGSVLILGFLVAGIVRLPLGAGIALAAMAGFAHGLAHGVEMPHTASGVHFLLGMGVATALLHTAGVIGGTAVQKWAGAQRAVGAGIIAGGLFLAIS